MRRRFPCGAVRVVGGGTAGAAIAAGLLLNVRFLPMGFAAGSAFVGGAAARAMQGQAVVDASFRVRADPDRAGWVARGRCERRRSPRPVEWPMRVWLIIASLAVGTAAIKSVGPIAVGGDSPRSGSRA